MGSRQANDLQEEAFFCASIFPDLAGRAKQQLYALLGGYN
jgi:hypothetical protein